MSTIGDAMREGKLSDLKPGMNRIILGRMLAYQLQVGRGRHRHRHDPGQRGRAAAPSCPDLQEFQVVGIFEVGLQEHDSVLALVNLAGRRGAARAVGPDRHPAQVRRRAEGARAGAQGRGAAAAGASRCATGRRRTQAYFRAIRIEKTMMGLILMLIVAVAVFNIVATLVMVVSDKRTDIAILRTLGMSPRGVLAVFMTQGVLIGWIGTAIGVSLGVALALHVDVVVPFLEHTFGIHIMDDPDVYYIIGAAERDCTPGDVVRIAAGRPAADASSPRSIPALQAAKTQPAEALRYE